MTHRGHPSRLAGAKETPGQGLSQPTPSRFFGRTVREERADTSLSPARGHRLGAGHHQDVPANQLSRTPGPALPKRVFRSRHRGRNPEHPPERACKITFGLYPEPHHCLGPRGRRTGHPFHRQTRDEELRLERPGTKAVHPDLRGNTEHSAQAPATFLDVQRSGQRSREVRTPNGDVEARIGRQGGNESGSMRAETKIIEIASTDHDRQGGAPHRRVVESLPFEVKKEANRRGRLRRPFGA